MIDEQVRSSSLFDVILPKLELLGWTAAALGFGARWLGYHQTSLVLVFGMGVLALTLFLRSFAPVLPLTEAAAAGRPASEKPDFLLDVVVPKVQGIGGAIMLIGALFKLMFWYGATAPLAAGFFSLLTATSIQAAWQYFNRRNQILVVIGAVVWAVPSETWIRQFYPHNSAQQQQILKQLAHPPRRTSR